MEKETIYSIPVGKSTDVSMKIKNNIITLVVEQKQQNVIDQKISMSEIYFKDEEITNFHNAINLLIDKMEE